MRLPWPDKRLSPNARIHWAQKAHVVDEAKRGAYYLALADGLSLPDEPLQVWIKVCPPDKRRRDIDNIHASLKAALDGIFRAAGVDDSQVKRTVLDWGEVEQGGAVYVSIAPLEIVVEAVE